MVVTAMSLVSYLLSEICTLIRKYTSSCQLTKLISKKNSTVLELFPSPPSKENSMVVRPSVSLLYKPGITSLPLSLTALNSLPSKRVLTLTFFTLYFDQLQLLFNVYLVCHWWWWWWWWCFVCLCVCACVRACIHITVFLSPCFFFLAL